MAGFLFVRILTVRNSSLVFRDLFPQYFLEERFKGLKSLVSALAEFLGREPSLALAAGASEQAVLEKSIRERAP